MTRRLACVFLLCAVGVQFDLSCAFSAVPDGLRQHIREAANRGEAFRVVTFTTDGGWFIATDKRVFAGNR